MLNSRHLSRRVAASMLVATMSLAVGCAAQPAQESSREPEVALEVDPQPEVKPEVEAEEAVEPQAEEEQGTLTSPADIMLRQVDDEGWAYAFTYDGEEYQVAYEPDTWTIYDSYRITNHDDLVMICQALLDEHPVHGNDLESIRTAEDMAFEWEQHNFVYLSLPANSPWRENAKDVDLDPDDQGKTYQEMYESRTGEEFDISDFDALF